MTASWKVAGLTYNRYLAIASRAVRNSLKEEQRMAAARRGELDLRFSKWENGKQQETKNLADEIAKISEAPASGN
ncbi:Mitochondrial ATP synthase epsilon chain domain-containing protein [Ascosphaera apis ARSEF 7405]|uniref:Mitochondrial ATP synthase epsilon chain domain-containing protein n=1 Tax=Ascosphaera apis ARSEF 7405 TaxID=392613 RepID=A0A168BPV4_9EURO|nr:Mitochondrial ATP synthase epsilon chain domain-containing protein [Ascosphaera apis ARSEF 7405]